MTAPIPFIWPVSTYSKLVAHFFDYDAAVDFVNATTDRELYIGEPKYDRRKAVWVISEPKDIGDGRFQVAA